MSKVMYHYALDENGNAVSIEDVSDETRHEHTYHCLGCGGKLIPRLGNVRVHHFAHEEDDGHCSKETYLHKLGKRIIKEKFNKDSQFVIEYYNKVFCSDLHNCPLSNREACSSYKLRGYDLKQYYNTCQEEKEIKGLVADLLLTNTLNPKRDPILIEIQVTHKSSEKKINSGLRIIELNIQSEEDVHNLLSSKISESLEYLDGTASDKHTKGYAKFFNFNRDNCAPEPLNKKLIKKFYLFKSGKAYVTRIEDEVYCRSAFKKDKSNTVFEAGFDCPDLWGTSLYDQGYMAARQNGISVKTCHYCKYHTIDDLGVSPLFCKLSRKYGTKQNPEANEAIKCSYYSEDKKLLEEICQQMPPYILAR